MKFFLLSFIVFSCLSLSSLRAQTLYFPPLSSSAAWDTLSPTSLGWCADEIDTLYQFLQQENTKAFVVLKDGKIVLEKYFGTFTKDSVWYWASAGKTITSFLVGKAQEEGYLSISDTSSQYMGVGWTNCTVGQENKISIRNQLTMTTGLDDGIADNHCTLDTCLNYLADAGTRWAYHNAPYTLLEKVLTNATGTAINTYTQQKLKNQTGITGSWFTVDYDNVFFSKARSMARFGLLAQNKFVWNGNILLSDTTYIHQMTNTSQTINNAYGYLWWLNGKSSYMLPSSQIVFPGTLAPDAPSDMFAGMGKNGQIVSIAPSKELVVVRMGNQPNSPLSEVPNIFCNQIWQKLNAVMCNTTTIDKDDFLTNLMPYPNPFNSKIQIKNKIENIYFELLDSYGKIIYKGNNIEEQDFTNLSKGLYILTIQNFNSFTSFKLQK